MSKLTIRVTDENILSKCRKASLLLTYVIPYICYRITQIYNNLIARILLNIGEVANQKDQTNFISIKRKRESGEGRE